MEVNKKLYESYIKEITPVHSRLANMGRAFLCGGLVCLLGQAVTDGLTAAGLDQEGAAAWNQLFLIGLAILLTGLGLFSRIAKFAGPSPGSPTPWRRR